MSYHLYEKSTTYRFIYGYLFALEFQLNRLFQIREVRINYFN